MEDQYGNELSTSSQRARDAYVEAVNRFLAADGGIEEAFQIAIDADENFALAHLGLARIRQMFAKISLVAEPLAKARAQVEHLTPREIGQIRAIGLLLEGKGPEAYKAIRSHLDHYPRDVMVAQTCMGVFGLIGFSGQQGRESEQLAFTTWLAPHYGDDWWFLSQHAFAQLEVGQTGPAERTIERSLSGNPLSANGAHVRSHLYYENGETEAGADYLDKWRRNYDKRGLLHCHISWHVALWAMARGDAAKMWGVIDADIAPGSALGPPINILTDLAAILYRAELAGIEVPAHRWRGVSEYALNCFPRPGIAFADIHAALAHALAGNTEALAKIIREAKGPAADLVGAFAQAFGAMARENWAQAVAHFSSAMADHARIGGSRAQRDLLEFAMAAAFLRQGLSDQARFILSIRRPKTTHSHALKGLL
ncbi:MAG: tetratricopeptide repeat protein [Roseicyclus sp.]|nr:tetratricopeptide repeat protein [Roseicyclus sp.]